MFFLAFLAWAGPLFGAAGAVYGAQADLGFFVVLACWRPLWWSTHGDGVTPLLKYVFSSSGI